MDIRWAIQPAESPGLNPVFFLEYTLPLQDHPKPKNCELSDHES